MSELLRRLRTELTRSPKKTAILAFGLVVAAVFWGRALWKPSNDAPIEADPASASSAVVVSGLPASAAPPALGGPAKGATGGTNRTGEPSWDDLLVWMRSTMDGGAAETSRSVERDPFEANDPTLATASLTPEPEEEEEPNLDAAPAEPVAPPVDPIRVAAAGMQVQGLLKVGNRRFVQMAGRTLSVGEEFELPGFRNDQGETSVWVVAEIDAEGVVIGPSAGGEPLRLSLKKPEPVGVRVERLDEEE